MPCRTGPITDNEISDELEIKQLDLALKKLNHITAMLCTLCKITGSDNLKKNDDIYRWYMKHEAEDSIRNRYLEIIDEEKNNIKNKVRAVLKIVDKVDKDIKEDIFGEIYSNLDKYKKSQGYQ
mgnify:CR=1 FL=1